MCYFISFAKALLPTAEVVFPSDSVVEGYKINKWNDEGSSE